MKSRQALSEPRERSAQGRVPGSRPKTGESDWSKDGDYRVTCFAGDVLEVLRPPRPVLVGASLGGLTAMLLAGELSPAAAPSVNNGEAPPHWPPSAKPCRIQAIRIGGAAQPMAAAVGRSPITQVVTSMRTLDATRTRFAAIPVAVVPGDRSPADGRRSQRRESRTRREWRSFRSGPKRRAGQGKSPKRLRR
jgi:pimeloyl-ACP methyl ester carboxylesterase